MCAATISANHSSAKSIPVEEQLSALELAALASVSRKLSERRAELSPGTYSVDLIVRIHGGLTVRPDQEDVATPGDAVALAAWCYRQLGRRARARLVAAISKDGRVTITKEDREAVAPLLEATRGRTRRSGAVQGTLVAETLERDLTQQ